LAFQTKGRRCRSWRSVWSSYIRERCWTERTRPTETI